MLELIKKIEKIIEGGSLYTLLNFEETAVMPELKGEPPYKYGWCKIVMLEGISTKITVSNIRYDNKKYDEDVSDVFMLVTTNHNVRQVVSPSLTNKIGNINISVKLALKLIRMYKLKPGDCIWLSDKGNVFAGSKKIKPGKLLKLLGVSSFMMDELINNFKLMNLNFSKAIKKGNAREVYTSPKLKISSCMAGRDIELYDVMAVECLYLPDTNGNIIARALLWEGKYFDRVYATSDALKNALTDYLKSVYNSVPAGYTSKWVKGTYDKYFIPYMDTLKGIEIGDGEFRFTVKQQALMAINTDGCVSS